MSRNVEKPTEEHESRPGHERVIRKHPAFGMIGAHRYQGGNDFMFGSPIRHNGGITVTIQQATEECEGHSTWHFAKKLICEVNMSENQWATFVSTLNMGSGVPCTMSHYYGPDGFVAAPGIDDTMEMDRRKELIKDRVRQDLEKLQSFVTMFDRLLNEAKAPTKAQLKELRGMLTGPVEQAAQNYAFFAETLSEHGDDVIASAKAEVNAYVTRIAMQYPALQATAPQVPMIEQRGTHDPEYVEQDQAYIEWDGGKTDA